MLFFKYFLQIQCDFGSMYFNGILVNNPNKEL